MIKFSPKVSRVNLQQTSKYFLMKEAETLSETLNVCSEFVRPIALADSITVTHLLFTLCKDHFNHSIFVLKLTGFTEVFLIDHLI